MKFKPVFQTIYIPYCLHWNQISKVNVSAANRVDKRQQEFSKNSFGRLESPILLGTCGVSLNTGLSVNCSPVNHSLVNWNVN